MPHAIAENVSAAAPLNPATYNLLLEHNVDAQSLRAPILGQQALIMDSLDDIQIMLAMSRPETIEPVAGVHETRMLRSPLSKFMVAQFTGNEVDIVKTGDKERFARQYDQIRRDPVAKVHHDNTIVRRYLEQLGTNNDMRLPNGADAGFELGKIRRLLENNFANLPEDSKKPELRMTEALVAEEMALLWRPQALADSKRGENPLGDIIADPKDKNVFNAETSAGLGDEQLWCLTGARASEEAADLFRDVYKSKTATKAVRTDALDRQVDMDIRALKLRILSESEPQPRLEDGIKKLASEHLRLLTAWWKDDRLASGIGRPLLFESICLAKERADRIIAGSDEFVRKAMPREDSIHKDVQPVMTRDQQKVNLSSDVIVEDASGNIIVSYQAKLWLKDKYYSERPEETRRRYKDKGIYPSERVKLIFRDSPGYRQLVGPDPVLEHRD